MTETSNSTVDAFPADLSPAERRVWAAFRRGERCDFTGGPVAAPVDGTTFSSSGEERIPAPPRGYGSDWGEERTVRAQVIARLLLHGPDSLPGCVPTLMVSGARITGRLDLHCATLTNFIELRECRFEGTIAIPEVSAVTFRLVRCVIPKINARRLRVDGELQIKNCRIEQGVALTDAHIGLDLDLRGSHIGRDPRGRAVAADGLHVGMDLTAHGPFRAVGTVSLRNARIGGRATFYGARIEPVNGARAFDGQGLHVEQSLHFSDRFSATGPIRLSDARLGDAVVISSPHIGQTPGADLVLWRATARTLHLELERPAHGRIVLNGVTVERLTDTPDAWPEEPGRVQISGFTYQYMGSSEPMTVEQRLQWLRNSVPEYAPQPYEQLASAFRAVGEDENARAVLLAKQRHRRTTLSFAGRLWGHLQDVTIGYGYRPARALGWLVALIALGTALFAADPPPPIKADEVPHWNPFFYTLDLLIPVVSLGQETAWKPSGVGQAVAYTLVLIGWVLAGAAAAGATRVLNRQ